MVTLYPFLHVYLIIYYTLYNLFIYKLFKLINVFYFYLFIFLTYLLLKATYFLYLFVCTDCLWVFLPEINVFIFVKAYIVVKGIS